jgi:tetratricopeptide (TPR) repeat protein
MDIRSRDNTDIVNRTARALIRDRDAAAIPHLGSARLYSEERRALAEAYGIATVRRMARSGGLVYSHSPRGLVLEIPAGLGSEIDGFLVLRAIARETGEPADRDLHERYALAVLLSRAERRARGALWVRGCIGSLNAGLVWRAAEARAVLRDVVRIQRRLRMDDLYRSGRAAREMARYVDAEGHFRAGLRAAQVYHDTEYQALCLTGLGRTRSALGDNAAAERELRRAVAIAGRHSHRLALAGACHAASFVAFDAGDAVEALRFAQRAFRAYPRRSPLRIRLASDIATMWLRRGEFGPALRVFRAVADAIGDEPGRMLARSNVARAAAGSGDRIGFEAAWNLAWAWASGLPESTHAASVLSNLGVAALTANEYHRAEGAFALAQVAAARANEAGALAFIAVAQENLRVHKRIEARARPARASMRFAATVSAGLAA